MVITVAFRSDVKDGKKRIQPSQNFEHIFIGWWKMLNTREVNIMYERIAGKFPYYSGAECLYHT